MIPRRAPPRPPRAQTPREEACSRRCLPRAGTEPRARTRAAAFGLRVVAGAFGCGGRVRAERFFAPRIGASADALWSFPKRILVIIKGSFRGKSQTTPEALFVWGNSRLNYHPRSQELYKNTKVVYFTKGVDDEKGKSKKTPGYSVGYVTGRRVASAVSVNCICAVKTRRISAVTSREASHTHAQDARSHASGRTRLWHRQSEQQDIHERHRQWGRHDALRPSHLLQP